MRDLFDDFMEELRRREAAARGEDPGPPRSPDREPGETDDADEDIDAGTESTDGEAVEASDSDLDADAKPDDDSVDDTDTFARPRSLDDARRGG